MKKTMPMFLFCALLATAGCSQGSGGGDTPEPVAPPFVYRYPVSISTVFTRATEDAFSNGDKAGLFMVNHKGDSTKAELKTSGNYVDNLPCSYNYGWTLDSTVYWSDHTTPADFYLYYPYTADIASVNAMPVSVSPNQSSEKAYKAANFIAGAATDVKPGEKAVLITVRQMTGTVRVKLSPGSGMSDDEMKKANVSVRIKGLRVNALVDIANGKITPVGDTATITPYYNKTVYSAMVVPQDIKQGLFAVITVNGREYMLETPATTLAAGGNHILTATIDKNQYGISVSIAKWEDDGTDYGGTAQ